MGTTTTSIRRHHPRVLRLAVGIVLGACFVMQQLKFEKAHYYHSSSASSSSEISTSLMMGDHHVLGGGESTGTRDKPLLLQVPYYVYAESPLHWMNFAFQEPTDKNNNNKKNKNGKKKKQQEQQSNTTTTTAFTFTFTSTATRRDDGTEYSDYKHSDDLWLSRASLRHPMRTHDPSQAKLFFVPLLLNAVASHDLCVQIKVQMKMNATPSASSSSSSSSWKEECFIGGGFGGRGRKGGRIHKAYKWAHTYLEQSEYFQRNQGKDHVVVHSHYNTPSKNTRTDKPNLFRCNMINFEGHSPIPRGIKQQQQPPAGGGLRRTVIPAFRIGNPCPIQQQQQQQQEQESSSSSAMIIGNNNNNYYATGVAEDKDTTTTTTTTTSRNRTHDFVMVASLHVGKKGFASRSDICQWLLEAKSSSSSASTTGSGNNNNDHDDHDHDDNDTSQQQQQQQHSYSVSHCGEGQQCPALIQAKYGFHVRGDTLGSNRVMDLLLSRTIPLFTDPGQYDILPHVGDIPWKNFTYLVNVTTRESFHESLEWILSRPASEYHEMLRLIEEYRHIWDHTQIYQFDAYMAEFAKRLSLQ